MTWSAKWDDESYGIDDLTAGDVVLLQQLTGDSWDAVQRPMKSPTHLVSLFTTIAARRLSLEDAIRRVHTVPFRDLLAAIEVTDGDND